jgi:iron complex transport system substrate-binding protein
MLAESGLRSAAGDLGFAFGGFASLETIVQLRPDFIVVARAGNVARDDGQAFLLHPALQRFYPPEKRIVIPERMTECGGVMLADALDALAAEIRRVGK